MRFVLDLDDALERVQAVAVKAFHRKCGHRESFPPRLVDTTHC